MKCVVTGCTILLAALICTASTSHAMSIESTDDYWIDFRDLGPPLMLEATSPPDIADTRVFFELLGITATLSDGSRFPDVLDDYNSAGALYSDSFWFGPASNLREIDEAAAKTALNAKLATLSRLDLEIIRTRDGVEEVIYTSSLSPPTVEEVIDWGSGVSFAFAWYDTFDLSELPGSMTTMQTNDLVRYRITGVPEPSTLVLLGIGAISLLVYIRRRRRTL